MISTITGNNSLEARRQLKAMIDKFVAEFGDLAVERLDGEEIEPQVVIDAVQSLPFLATKKLVIVRNLSTNKQAAENIEQIISSVSTPVDLVFYETKPDKRTAFYKVLKSQTDFSEFNELDPRSLPKWLVDYAKDQGAEISFSDANYLVERVGADQQLLGSELDKLVTYTPKISRESIDLLTEKTPQSKVFDLLDAAFAGNKKRALALYEEQRAQKVEPQEIIAMLAWQLRLVTFAKLGQGKTAETIAKDSGTSPYPITKAQTLAAKTEPAKLARMVNEAQAIDKRGKSVPLDLDEAIKAYIVSVL